MKSLLWLLCCLAPLLPALSQEAGLSTRMLGSWEGNGQLFGREAQFSMQWEPTLEGAYLSLTFRNVFTDKEGKEQSMEAIAFYDLKKGEGQWFDSRGQTLPLRFEMREEVFTVFWGDTDTESGKTVYTFRGDQASVEDFFYREEAYVLFGQAEYRRQIK